MLNCIGNVLRYFTEPVAQSVEQQPFKLWVVGSIPTRLTSIYLRNFIICPHRLVVRTPGFHPGNRGSTPLGDAKIKILFVLILAQIHKNKKNLEIILIIKL